MGYHECITQPKENTMSITFTPKLTAYMAKKGYSHIVVELVDSGTSTSGFADIVCRPVNPKGAQLMEDKVIRRLQAEGGEVLITQRALEYDDDIVFDLKSFLGIKDIVVAGIRAWSM